MKELFERVSIRKFTDEPVEDEKILAILRAAMAAPSAGNQQPWEFFVVRDRAILEKLSEVSPYAGCTKKAPVAIVSAYREGLWAQDYAQIDMSIAMENLWLACGGQGLGGVWLGIAPQTDRMRIVEEIIDMDPSLSAFALVPVGYPAEERKQQDRFDPERIHYCR